MVSWFAELIKALWILLPAYTANGLPPFSRGKRPIDFGKKMFDGNRVFGDGKTIEGLIFGVGSGTLVGVIQTFLQPHINSYFLNVGFSLPTMTFFVGFMISLGALVGDAVASFVKRRFRLPRGADVPLMDQWNFVIGLLVFSFWLIEINIYMILIMLLITPVIHRLANIFAYKLKIKREPW